MCVVRECDRDVINECQIEVQVIIENNINERFNSNEVSDYYLLILAEFAQIIRNNCTSFWCVWQM